MRAVSLSCAMHETAMHIKEAGQAEWRAGRGGAGRGGRGGGADSCLRPVYDGHVEQQQISCLEIGADAHLSRPGRESRRKLGGGGVHQGV